MEVVIPQQKALLFTCGDDSTCKIWDISSGELVHTLKGHTSGVACVTWYQTKYIFTGGRDTLICVWNFQTGKLVTKLVGHQGSVWYLMVYDDKLFSASWDHSVIVWNIKTLKKLGMLISHEDNVYCLEKYEKDGLVITGSLDGLIHFFDSTRPFNYKLQSHSNLSELLAKSRSTSKTNVKLDPVARFIPTCTSMYNNNNAEIPLSSSSSSSSSLLLSPSSSSSSSNILSENSDEDKNHHKQLMDDNGVEQEGDVFIDEELQKDTNYYPCIHAFYDSGGVYHMKVVNDLLITATTSSDISVYNIRTRQFVKKLCGHKGLVWCLQYYPKLDFLLSGSWDHHVKVWNLCDGKTVYDINAHNANVRCVEFYEQRGPCDQKIQGSYILTCAEDCHVKFWSMETGTFVRSLKCHKKWILSIRVYVPPSAAVYHKLGAYLHGKVLADVTLQFR